VTGSALNPGRAGVWDCYFWVCVGFLFNDRIGHLLVLKALVADLLDFHWSEM
jgi:hypothetical protein